MNHREQLVDMAGSLYLRPEQAAAWLWAMRVINAAGNLPEWTHWHQPGCTCAYCQFQRLLKEGGE